MKTHFLFTCMLAVASCLDTSAQEYENAIATYTDPLTKGQFHSILIRANSEERLVAGTRFSLKAHIIKMKVDDKTEYHARMVIRNSPEEWPLNNTGYLLVNDIQYPLELIQINPRNTSVVSTSGMDGDVSVSTTEYQLYRIECKLPSDVIQSIKLQDKMLLVVYSGVYPATFEFDKGEIFDLYSLIKYRK